MKRYALAALALVVAALPSSAQLLGPNQPPDQWAMNCTFERGRECSVSALIDGGPSNFLGTFLIVKYSAATETLTIAVDGIGQSASVQVDWHPVPHDHAVRRRRMPVPEGRGGGPRAADAGRPAHRGAGFAAERFGGRAAAAEPERLRHPVSPRRRGPESPLIKAL